MGFHTIRLSKSAPLMSAMVFSFYRSYETGANSSNNLPELFDMFSIFFIEYCKFLPVQKYRFFMKQSTLLQKKLHIVFYYCKQIFDAE